MGKKILAVFMVAFAAAAAGAAPGSVISSFHAQGYFVTGAYRADDYVYVIDYAGTNWIYGLKYTPAGEYSSSSAAYYLPNFFPEDPDHSYLGTGYITIAAEGGIGTWPLAGGTITEWRHIGLIETQGYAYNAGSPYYYLAVKPESNPVVIYRVTTAGSLVGSFTSPGGNKLAAADRFNGAPGDYLIVTGPTSFVYDAAGSLVATFNI